jgi:hypothetical protein
MWGLLWGPLIHFEEIRHMSNQLATSSEFTEPEGYPPLALMILLS